MYIRSAILLALMSFPAAGQQPSAMPGSSQYNSVYLPAHGLGDTRKGGGVQKWGAFARAESGGYAGVGLNKPTQAVAEEIALSECAKQGGRDCTVFFVFLNQCAAVATRDESTVWARGPTLRAVRKEALMRCGTSECEVVFERCLR